MGAEMWKSGLEIGGRLLTDQTFVYNTLTGETIFWLGNNDNYEKDEMHSTILSMQWICAKHTYNAPKLI